MSLLNQCHTLDTQFSHFLDIFTHPAKFFCLYLRALLRKSSLSQAIKIHDFYCFTICLHCRRPRSGTMHFYCFEFAHKS